MENEINFMKLAFKINLKLAVRMSMTIIIRVVLFVKW